MVFFWLLRTALYRFCSVQRAVARLTRFEGRGHKKVPKGPPFAYVFRKKFRNKLSKGGVLAFSPLPLDLTGGGHGPLAPPPLNAPLPACGPFIRFNFEFIISFPFSLLLTTSVFYVVWTWAFALTAMAHSWLFWVYSMFLCLLENIKFYSCPKFAGCGAFLALGFCLNLPLVDQAPLWSTVAVWVCNKTWISRLIHKLNGLKFILKRRQMESIALFCSKPEFETGWWRTRKSLNNPPLHLKNATGDAWCQPIHHMFGF